MADDDYGKNEKWGSDSEYLWRKFWEAVRESEDNDEN